MRTKGEGVKKSENCDDIISGRSLNPLFISRIDIFTATNSYPLSRFEGKQASNFDSFVVSSTLKKIERFRLRMRRMVRHKLL